MIKENNILNLLIKQKKSANELADYLGLSLNEIENYILMNKFLTWQIVYLCSKFFKVKPIEVLKCQPINI